MQSNSANIMLAKCEHAKSTETTSNGEAVPAVVVEKLDSHLSAVRGWDSWKLHPDMYTSSEVAFMGTRYGEHGDTHLVTIAYNLDANTARITEYVF